MYACALAVTRSPELAEDAVQAAMQKLLAAAGFAAGNLLTDKPDQKPAPVVVELEVSGKSFDFTRCSDPFPPGHLPARAAEEDL